MTDFHESRIPSITSGKTTRSDVLQLLGKPSGQEIFPLLKIQGERRLIYTYARVRGDSALIAKSGMTTLSRTPTDLKTYSKSLVVSFDANDIVSDVKFTSSGAK
jgi:outer membrane protein assembly factor BamE (lipoprotein component of BamABCDE complex)